MSAQTLQHWLQTRLLHVDGLAAAISGVVMLSLRGWLSGFYRLPKGLLFFIGVVSLVYASYSLTLAVQARRPRPLILLLVAANSLWALACLRWVIVYSETASPLGPIHLSVEALFVGGLAFLEWRWREHLRTA